MKFDVLAAGKQFSSHLLSFLVRFDVLADGTER
jgi:hypothetical protein